MDNQKWVKVTLKEFQENMYKHNLYIIKFERDYIIFGPKHGVIKAKCNPKLKDYCILDDTSDIKK
jgi:hypothetical protein